MGLSVADYGYVLETGRLALGGKPDAWGNDAIRAAYLGGKTKAHAQAVQPHPYNSEIASDQAGRRVRHLQLNAFVIDASRPTWARWRTHAMSECCFH